jgi:hypothetical protein
MKNKDKNRVINATVTESIRIYLQSRTHSDLAGLYSPDMETQVNVAADGGEPDPERRNTYSDIAQRWFHIRIPKDAKDEPHFKDYPLPFSLDEHAEGIGMTGWDWRNRRSRWVAFDYDAITGHAIGIGVSEDELRGILEAAKAIPWVTVRKSTSGKGLHLYVFFANPPETLNHTEHAALARAVLAQMSMLANFDFCSAVDACGGNMWVWHRKMIDKGEKIGLHLIKQGEPLKELPQNWQAHLEVVRKERSKVCPIGIAVSEMDVFQKMASARPPIKVDNEHRELMVWLEKNGFYAAWDQDHRRMITHTAGLKAAHEALKLKGTFKTLASGKTEGDHNCFCFPEKDGAWFVYRFTQGIKEANSWSTSEHNWTYCHFNQAGDLKSAAAANGGIKTPDGRFAFETAASAGQALKVLGFDLNLPDRLAGREVKVQSRKGEFVARVPLEKNDDAKAMRQAGWVKDKDDWAKVFEPELKVRAASEPTVARDLDEHLRHLVAPNLGDAGWTVRDKKGRWLDEPKGNVKSVLKSWNMSDTDAEAILGHLVVHVWDLVNLPFQDEFPGDRRWNRDGARLAFLPTTDDRRMAHPHSDMIFNHCGAGLNRAVAENEWCKLHSVLTGGDYLRLWAAVLVQRPTHPLPYLFLFSEQRGEQHLEIQNAGKSSLHQAIGLLMRYGKGYVEADTALTDPRGFNRQLAGAILCYVEETDLSQSKVAYSRIKNWVTGDNLEIHPKGIDPYMMPNTTHWIQCANSREACPVFPGDKRIVMIQVPALTVAEIPWHSAMRPALEREAPDFLRTLLDIELPTPECRVWLPVLETEAKRDALAVTGGASRDSAPGIDEEQLVDLVRQFIAERVYTELGGQRLPVGSRDYWQGTFGTLAKLLGWDDIEPNQLSRALRLVRERLREHGIEVVLPDEQSKRSANERKVTIASSWLLEPEWSLEEQATDAERVDRLLDDMPPHAV